MSGSTFDFCWYFIHYFLSLPEQCLWSTSSRSVFLLFGALRVTMAERMPEGGSGQPPGSLAAADSTKATTHAETLSAKSSADPSVKWQGAQGSSSLPFGDVSRQHS